MKGRSLLTCGALILAACDPPTKTARDGPDSPLAAIAQRLPPSPWYVSTSVNELSGEKTVRAETGLGRQTLIIRQIGKKLDCYVNTGQFLETIENIDTHLCPIKYKFDDGPIVQQSWILASDNEGLFFPGNPSAFLRKMRSSSRLVIEFKPADRVPATMSFDVSQFPKEAADLITALKN